MEVIQIQGSEFKIKLVHKSLIGIGDTILCSDGHVRTVCRNNIKRSEFMGKTIFGDSYRLGYQKVKKILI